MARGISLPRASGGYACDELVVNVRFILRRVDDLEFAACPVMGNERYRLDLEIPQPPVRGFLSLIVGPGGQPSGASIAGAVAAATSMEH